MHFYNLYLKMEGSPVSAEFSDILCVKHGFHFVNSIKYVAAIVALLRRRWKLGLVFMFISLFVSKMITSVSASFPSDSIISGVIGFFALYVLGSCLNAFVENDAIQSDSKWLGVFYARNEDDAIRSFFATLENKLSLQSK